MTNRKTLAGAPKVTGKTSSLESPKGRKIRKALWPWVSKPLKTGRVAAAQRALTKVGVKTKYKQPVSSQQAKSWLMSLKKAQKKVARRCWMASARR